MASFVEFFAARPRHNTGLAHEKHTATHKTQRKTERRTHLETVRRSSGSSAAAVGHRPRCLLSSAPPQSPRRPAAGALLPSRTRPLCPPFPPAGARFRPPGYCLRRAAGGGAQRVSPLRVSAI